MVDVTGEEEPEMKKTGAAVTALVLAGFAAIAAGAALLSAAAGCITAGVELVALAVLLAAGSDGERHG